MAKAQNVKDSPSVHEKVIELARSEKFSDFREFWRISGYQYPFFPILQPRSCLFVKIRKERPLEADVALQAHNFQSRKGGIFNPPGDGAASFPRLHDDLETGKVLPCPRDYCCSRFYAPSKV